MANRSPDLGPVLTIRLATLKSGVHAAKEDDLPTGRSRSFQYRKQRHSQRDLDEAAASILYQRPYHRISQCISNRISYFYIYINMLYKYDTDDTRTDPCTRTRAPAAGGSCTAGKS
jgi:hypothetical protein